MTLVMLASVEVVGAYTSDDGNASANEGLGSQEGDEETTCHDAPKLHERVKWSFVGRVPAVGIVGLSKDDDTGVDHNEDHDFETRSELYHVLERKEKNGHPHHHAR